MTHEKTEKMFAALNEMREVFEDVRRKNKDEADAFWNGLSYEDKCNAFHAVVERLVQGELKDKGSYRWVLYDVFGFDMDMYTRGMDCGFMQLHNSIEYEDEENDKGRY